MLEEFNPPNPGLLGMNVGRQKIFIRLRPAGALGVCFFRSRIAFWLVVALSSFSR